jgi:hypothetical protein
MLREPQRERKIINNIEFPPVRSFVKLRTGSEYSLPEPAEGSKDSERFFSRLLL